MGDLKVLETAPAIDHGAVIGVVEKWLKDRKAAGASQPLAAVAIVSVYADGSVGSMYDGGDKFFPLMAGLFTLMQRMDREAELLDG